MDNKYFSVEEMNNLIGNMELAFTDYSDKADTFISKCKQFQNDDSFMGEKATVVKDLVGDKEVDLVNAQKDMQAKLLAMYKHSVQSFAEKVDSAPNARLDLDTLDMVESDLKAIYEEVDTTCAEIESIAKEMEAKYGHLGHITVPNADPLRESLEELCGGYNPESGSIYDLKQKFINWDEEECAYIESQLLSDEIERTSSSIIQANTTLDGVLNGSAGADDNLFDKKMYLLNNHPKLLLNNDGVKDTTNDGDSDKDIDAEDVIFEIMYYFIKNNLKKELDIFCENNSKTIASLKNELIFSYLQKRYNFTDEEMKYFKENQESALISLHLAIKYNTAVADEIHNKLIKMYYDCGQGYLDDAHRLLEQYNITDEQKEKIKKIESKIGYKHYYYDNKGKEQSIRLSYRKIASMEVAAAALYEYGADSEFVAAVFGNIAFEGSAGHIEDTNYYENDALGYLNSIEHYFENKTIIDADKASPITDGRFDVLFAGEDVFFLDNPKSFIDKLEEYRTISVNNKICGIGMCQWTTKDRLGYLLPLYKNGDYTFSEMAKAEATMLVKELSGEYKTGVDQVDDDCHTNYDDLDDENKVTECAKYFYEYYEIGKTDTADERGKVAYILYKELEGK